MSLERHRAVRVALSWVASSNLRNGRLSTAQRGALKWQLDKCYACATWTCTSECQGTMCMCNGYVHTWCTNASNNMSMSPTTIYIQYSTLYYIYVYTLFSEWQMGWIDKCVRWTASLAYKLAFWWIVIAMIYTPRCRPLQILQRILWMHEMLTHPNRKLSRARALSTNW